LFSHTDTGISEDKGIGCFVWDDFDFEVWLIFDQIWIGEGFVSDFVQSIGGVGDKFSEENFFVGVESVNDETHQLLDISIEGKVFCVLLILSHFFKDFLINLCQF
jgi:hypothetical protein